jgi:hypothetical protein
LPPVLEYQQMPVQFRDVCREICKQAYEKIKDLRAEHQAKWEEYKQQQQLWNLQWQEDKKRKWVEGGCLCGPVGAADGCT